MARWKDKALATLDGSESIPVTQGTTDKRTTVAAIRTWIIGQFSTVVQNLLGAADAAAARSILEVGEASVTNAAVNAAIEDDAAATRTSLGLGTAATAAAGDFDAAGAAATAQAAAAADATTKANAAETAAKAYADTLVVGLVDDRGNYDASGNVFPSAGGSGAAGAVLKGDLWTVSVAGTLGGVAVTAGDLVRALVDAPGQTAGNWAVTENNIGYVAEPAQTAVSQAEAEAGTSTSVRSWTPLRVFQAIAAKLALGTWISGATGKATPVDADTLPLSDSAASDALKKLTWANLKATLKTYFDTQYPNKVVAIGIACSDETTALTAGTAKATFRMPYAMTLTEVRASVNTAPTGSVLTVDINEAGSSILSTKLTIDATEKTSTTAAAPPVISDASLADDADITVDIDGVGSTIAGKGLKVWLIGTRA
jgi:hypothetical protein